MPPIKLILKFYELYLNIRIYIGRYFKAYGLINILVVFSGVWLGKKIIDTSGV